jgi:hypothetical protein
MKRILLGTLHYACLGAGTLMVTGLIGVVCERFGITEDPRLAIVLPLIAAMLIYVRRIRLSGEDLFFASVLAFAAVRALHWLLAFIMADGRASDAGFVIGLSGLAAYLAWQGVLWRRKKARMLTISPGEGI